MSIDEIIIGHRVLLQSGESVKEVAQVKGIASDRVIVKLSNGDITAVSPEYIIKDFGS